MTSAGFVGADTAQLYELATRLEQAATALDGVRSRVQSRLGTTTWKGQDAEHFGYEWRARHSPRLVTTASTLRAMAQSLRSNAVQQHDASADTGVPQPGHLVPVSPGGGGLERFVQDLLDMAGHAAGTVSGLAGLGGVLVNFNELQELTVSLRNLSLSLRSLDEAGRLLEETRLLGRIGVVAHVAELTVHVGQFASELMQGEFKWTSVLEVGWDVATFWPPLAIVDLGWEVGSTIGERAADFLQETTHYQDALYNGIIADQYDGPLTPAEAAELTDRYSGWDSYGNIAHDIVTSELHSAGEGIKSLWNKVF